MKITLRKAAGLSTALAIAFFTCGNGQGVAGHGARVSHRDKLDLHLRAALDAGAAEAQRVIIRGRPGERASLRQLLANPRDSILVEHDSLDAITAVVHAGDLETLSEQQQVISVSSD